MLTPTRFPLVELALVTIALSAAPLRAQQEQPPPPQAAPPAPVPPAIFSAKKKFPLQRRCRQRTLPSPLQRLARPRVNQFYAAMQKWRRYDLVDDPEDADLVFELRLTGPNGPANPDKPKGASEPLPIFRLAIVSRKSHFTLWTVTESVPPRRLAEKRTIAISTMLWQRCLPTSENWQRLPAINGKTRDASATQRTTTQTSRRTRLVDLFTCANESKFSDSLGITAFLMRVGFTWTAGEL